MKQLLLSLSQLVNEKVYLFFYQREIKSHDIHSTYLVYTQIILDCPLSLARYLPLVILILASEVGMYRYVHTRSPIYVKYDAMAQQICIMNAIDGSIFTFTFSDRTSVNSRSAINQAASGGFPSSTLNNLALRAWWLLFYV